MHNMYQHWPHALFVRVRKSFMSLVADFSIDSHPSSPKNITTKCWNSLANVFVNLMLIVPGKVTVDLANFDVKL
jgi:hypothetical protein